MSTNTEFITKSGVKAVLRPFITYGQHRDIMSSYLDEKQTKATTVEMADRKGVEAVLVSLNGNEKDIYEAFKALPLTDAQELTAEIKKVLDPKA